MNTIFKVPRLKFFNEASQEKVEVPNPVECSKRKNFLTCQQICERYSWPPKGGLRHLIFNAEKNGFCKVIKRVGRRILIDEDAFVRYIEEQTR